VGVLPALSDAFEDKEEELSARARGAAGGGLALDSLGGLNGRTWAEGVTAVNRARPPRGASTCSEGTSTHNLIDAREFPRGEFGPGGGAGRGHQAPGRQRGRRSVR